MVCVSPEASDPARCWGDDAVVTPAGVGVLLLPSKMSMPIFYSPTQPPALQPSRNFICFPRCSCLGAEHGPALQVSAQL